MLDLSLDHLGVITRPDDEVTPGETAAGLRQIIEEIGLGESHCLDAQRACTLVSHAEEDRNAKALDFGLYETEREGRCARQGAQDSCR
jgi:hypothetical protein